MKVGVIGSAAIDALRPAHDVVAASRNRTPRVDLADTASIATLFDDVTDADAVVCCAANAPLSQLTEHSDAAFFETIAPKLLGQVSVARHAARRLRDGGSITLTSGAIPEGLAGSAGGAMVNAGLEAFVRAAGPDLDRGLRIKRGQPRVGLGNAVRAWHGSGRRHAVSKVARSYVDAVEGSSQGKARTTPGVTSWDEGPN